MEDLLNQKEPDDLSSMCYSMFDRIPAKYILMTFILFFIVNTSTFIDNVVGLFNEAVDGRHPTEKGLLIQGLFICVALVIFSLV